MDGSPRELPVNPKWDTPALIAQMPSANFRFEDTEINFSVTKEVDMRELSVAEVSLVSGGEATGEGYLKSCVGGAVAGAMGAAATGVGVAVLPKAALAGCLIGMAGYGISELF